MIHFFTFIKTYYLRQIRSYSFLITIAISLLVSYTFIPAPDAPYVTIHANNYIGIYNSAWIGYITAVMSSIFISLFGFYLINSSIKKDNDSKVGTLIAATPISNFYYLIGKVCSNFLILLTITGVSILTSMFLFGIYHEPGLSLELSQFIIPYTVVTFPSIFVISCIAVILETLFGSKTSLLNVFFLVLFITMITNTPETENGFSGDLTGTKLIIHQIKEQVQSITQTDITSLAIGYIVKSDNTTLESFTFSGIHFPKYYLISRVLWILLGIIAVYISSFVFHRFRKKKKLSIATPTTVSKKAEITPFDISFLSSDMPYSTSILPLLKTEIKLLIRSTSKWIWILSIIGCIALFFTNDTISLQFVIPILWCLHLKTWGELVIKEKLHRVHYFSFIAFSPIKRVFMAQLICGWGLSILFVFPFIVRKLILLDVLSCFGIVIGGLFIISYSTCMGVLSRGKKLFEVTFLLITYINMNAISYFDYYGGINQNYMHLTIITFLSIGLLSVAILLRNKEIRSNY